MNKIRKLPLKILTIAIAFVTCFQVVGCKNNNQQTTEPSLETGKYIVTPQGTSEYKILTPASLDNYLQMAVSELQLGIKETCGYEMPVTNVYNEGDKYLSRGQTALTEKYAEKVGFIDLNSSRVLTVGDNVIIDGKDNTYVCFAVYDFMEKTFGFKWYTYEEAYVKKSNYIKLLNLDVTDVPDIVYRQIYDYDYYMGDIPLRNIRMRLEVQNGEKWFSDGHNMINVILRKDLYLAEHPEWFTRPDDKTDLAGIGQLCLSNEEMTAEFIERCKQIVTENWSDRKEYFCIGMEDNWYYCRCEKCVELAKKFSPTGDDSQRTGLFIWFSNKVVKAVNEWVKSIDPDKVIKFKIYAYFDNLHAPAKKVNGKYEPTCPEVVPDENILIWYAPISSNYAYSFNDPRNEEVSNDLLAWESLTKNIIIRSYSVDFSVHWLPFSNLLTNGGNYTMAAENNYYGYVDEGGYRFPNMMRLKQYMQAQMWWDASRGVDEVAYDFIDFYYKPVAAEFKEYYRTLKQFQIYQVEVLGINVPTQSSTYLDAKIWPYDMINVFSRQLDAMIAKLEPLKKVDPDLYQTFFDRVNVEKIWVYYVFCSLYKNKFNDTQYNEMIDFVEKYAVEYAVGSDEDMATVNAWRI